MSRNSRRKDANASEPSPQAPTAPVAPVRSVIDQPGVVFEPPGSADAGAVDELRDRIVELQSKVEQLVARSQADPVLSGDPEVDSASRTLRFAQQTADSVVAEAREEAATIVADAERQRSDIIRRAREQADLDYAAERDRVAMSSAGWQAQRAEVLEQLDSLNEIFALYQDGLSHLGATVTTVAERLRTGTIAEPVVVAAPDIEVLDAEPEPADQAEPVDPTDQLDQAVEPAPAIEAHVVESAPEPSVESVIDLTTSPAVPPVVPPEFGLPDQPVERPLTRNPFAPPVSQLKVVEASNDPFVFDPTELPEGTGDFAWENDAPGEPPRSAKPAAATPPESTGNTTTF